MVMNHQSSKKKVDGKNKSNTWMLRKLCRPNPLSKKWIGLDQILIVSGSAAALQIVSIYN